MLKFLNNINIYNFSSISTKKLRKNKKPKYNFFLPTGNSVHVLETQKIIKHTESQTEFRKASVYTFNKMVQTENVDGKIVIGDNNTEIRTFDECLAIYKSEVNIITITLITLIIFNIEIYANA